MDQKDPLEKEKASYSSILAWEIPRTEGPGRLYSPWGHKRVRHNLATRQQQDDIMKEADNEHPFEISKRNITMQSQCFKLLIKTS